MLAWAMMMPAIAGPMNRAELKTIELIGRDHETSWQGTDGGTDPWRGEFATE